MRNLAKMLAVLTCVDLYLLRLRSADDGFPGGEAPM